MRSIKYLHVSVISNGTSSQLTMKVILATIFIGLIANRFVDCKPECSKDGTGNAIIADPENCEKFWICRNYVPYPAFCPNSRYFDIKTLTCVDLEDVTCAGSPPPNPEEPEQPPVDCPVNVKPGDNVLLPNPKDCGSFYQCVHGYPHLIRCPNGLHFYDKKKRCDWPQLVQCSIKP